MDSKEKSEKKIGIFSVGTAGHVIPGVRIINELKEQGVDLNNILVVTGDRNEKKYYGKLNLEIIEHNFVRTKKSSIYYLINFIAVFKSIYFLHRLIRDYNISVIFTTGSYIGPLIAFLGYIKKIPTYLQEQNIYAGLGNYLGSFFGTKVYTSFPNTEHLYRKKIEFVGPVLERSIEENKSELMSNLDTLFKKGVVSIGVQGGSQGSEEINELVYELFHNWDKCPIRLIHITGGLEVKDFNNDIIQYTKFDFIDDMKTYYNSINIQITRGGGGLLESASLGIINIIVPYKYGTTSIHQKSNSEYLVNRQAAVMVENPDKEYLEEVIFSFLPEEIVRGQGSTKLPDVTEAYMNGARDSVKYGARELIASELYGEYRKSI